MCELATRSRYTRYREKQKEEHEAWLKRRKEREEKIAKGESVGPEERDPTAEEEVGLLGLLKFIVYVLVFSALAGKFFTGSFVWNFEDNLPSIKQFWPVRYLTIFPSTEEPSLKT